MQQTRFVYLRARYYDPATSQFLTRDPLLATTQDPYGYAANDPVNLTDPTGLWAFLVPVFLGAVSGAGLDLGIQALGNVMAGCPALSNINWGRTAASGLAGGLMGGLSGVSRLLGIGLRGKPSTIPSTWPKPNATVGDLTAFRPVEAIDPAKVSRLANLGPRRLLDSVNRPYTGQHITVNSQGYIKQGNHRARELLKQADDSRSPIGLDTPIVILRQLP